MTDEQRRWPAKADDALRGARLLLKDGLCNDANSRSYYVMFYVVCALMSEFEKRYKSHSSLISAFHDNWVKTGQVDKDYHRFITTAFDRRNSSDYDNVFQDTREASEQQIVRAEAFLKLGRELLAR